MHNIPDDLFYQEICPYLSPSTMMNLSLLGYRPSILRFLKQRHIKLDQLEELTCPCCGNWLFEEWYEVGELDLSHFDGFFTRNPRYPSEEGRYHSIIRYLKLSSRRVILCRMCQLKTYTCSNRICFPYSGSRKYNYSSKYGIVYYTKKKDDDGVIYWDEANL